MKAYRNVFQALCRTWWSGSKTKRRIVSFLSQTRSGRFQELRPIPLILLGSFSTVHCLSATSKEPEVTNDKAIVNKAIELYEAGEWQQIYDLLLRHRDTSNPEILWRLARAARDVSQLPDTTKDNKKKLVYECLEYAKKAVEHGPDNYACQKWCGIAMADVGDYEGMKVKIMNAFVIRNHFERAIKLNPRDSTSLHLLGRWCFTFADMPWYQHKAAAALFATPPTSTFEEALEYFEQAENNEPGFYCDNHLMLGKTHLKLGHKEEARQWLEKTIECKAKRPEDEKSQDEARKLLQTL